ncbi:unnamed protein product [Mucor hiemalis]
MTQITRGKSANNAYCGHYMQSGTMWTETNLEFAQMLYGGLDENSVQALEKFQELSDQFDVSYLNDPAVPVLVLKSRLYVNPFVFKEYIDEVPNESFSDESVTKLETKAQVLKFIGEVYSTEAVFDDMYTLKIVSLSEIFTKMVQCSTYFSRKTLGSFSSFCGKNKLDLMMKIHERDRKKKLVPTKLLTTRELSTVRITKS